MCWVRDILSASVLHVLWRYQIEEHNMPAHKEPIAIQADKIYVNEKKIYLLGQHKRAVQVFR